MGLVAGHPYKAQRPNVRVPSYSYAPTSPKAQLIVDVDYDSDCDDIADAAILMALRYLGECDVLAAIVSSAHPKAAPALLGHFNYWGAGDIPIGVNTSDPGNDESPNDWVSANAADFAVPGKTDASDFEDFLTTYRRELAAAADNSVTICMGGAATAFRALLLSPGDEFSPLSGRSLVRRKCRAVFLSAGWLPTSDPLIYGDIGLNTATRQDMNYVWRNCPVPFIFVAEWLTKSIPTGSICPKLSADNPLRAGWARYFGNESPDNTRVAGSQLSILAAVRGFAGNFQTIAKGQAVVSDVSGGAMSWSHGRGNNYYVRTLRYCSEFQSIIHDLISMEPELR